MKMFSNDISKINKDIETLKRMLKNTRNTKQIIKIFSSLNNLINLKEDITQTESLEFYSDINFINEYIKEHDKNESRNINNFIRNKDFHNKIASETLLILEDKRFDCELEEVNQKFSTKDMYEIMMDFLSKINKEKLLNKMIKEKRIFKVYNTMEIVGGTIFDNVLKNSYCYISNEINDITKMTTIIHELGHVTDTNRNIDSMYLESISMIYEKKFLDFLIKKRISPIDTISLIDDYYKEAYDNFKEVLVLSELDNGILRKQNYKKVNEDLLLKQLNGKQSLEYMDLSNIRYINLRGCLCYSYGKVIATYFTNLEKRDKELFNYKYKKFLSRDKRFLNEKEFKEIVTIPEVLFQSMEHELKKDNEIKQKIIKI